MKTASKLFAAVAVLLMCMTGGAKAQGGPCGPLSFCGSTQVKVLCPGGAWFWECDPNCSSVATECDATRGEVLAVAQKGDVSALLALAKEAPDFVRYNAGRSAVQILSCEGDGVIASFPVAGAQAMLADNRLLRMPTSIQAFAEVGLDLRSRASRAHVLNASTPSSKVTTQMTQVILQTASSFEGWRNTAAALTLQPQ